jgi:hypothetical protein
MLAKYIVQLHLIKICIVSLTDKALQDYRMTRVTFGVSATVVANMCDKQNALNHLLEFPSKGFLYVDDGLRQYSYIFSCTVYFQVELQQA